MNDELILGLESSCDETATAVVSGGTRVLSNVVASQYDLHRPFGGIVPEIAARAHCECVSALVDEALREANVRPEQLSAISVVNRPGLIGALLVGIAAAKALALAWHKPLITVDHIHGHVYAPALAGFVRYPQIALIVSGGHTCLYRVTGPGEIDALGQTRDDAAGEAFDKVAKMLELGFPGGPALARMADDVPLTERRLFADVAKNCEINTDPKRPLDFSFSGLKTAVYYHLRGTTRGRGELRAISPDERRAVAASFQEAACEIMTSRALAACRREGLSVLTVGGGVACNRRLRELLKERAAQETPRVEIFFPPVELCTDNAAMSAGLAVHSLRAGKISALDVDADATPKRAAKTQRPATV